MRDLMCRPVFSVKSEPARTFLWADVIIAADLHGHWRDVELNAQLGAACGRLADEGEELAAEEIEDAATDFRYRLGLLSADETTAWLEARGLTVDDWMQHIARTILRERWADVAAGQVTGDPDEADVRLEALCSGVLGRLADDLAARVAAGAEKPTAPEAMPAWTRDLYGMSAAECRERAEAIAAIDASFESFVGRVGGAAAVEREIGSRGVDWTRVGSRLVVLPREDAAREVLLLVREDGMDLGDAARVAGAEAVAWEPFLEDVDTSLADRLLGSLPGELLGPVEIDGGFALVLVNDKRDPSPADPEVLERAERRVIERATQSAVRDRIVWHERL